MPRPDERHACPAGALDPVRAPHSRVVTRPRQSPLPRSPSRCLDPLSPADLGVTYDLSPLQQQMQRIDDNRNESIASWYDYYFGVCSDLGESVSIWRWA